MKKFRLKYISLILILALCSANLTACDQNNNPDENQEAPAENQDNPETPDNADDPAPADNAPAPANEEAPTVPEEPQNTPIAERSPIEITRIEPDAPNYNDPEPVSTTPQVTGAGPENESEVIPPTETEEEDPHHHDPIPNLFPIDECQVEINGVYDSKFSKELVDAINARRKDYMIGEVTRNTSLLACADTRCKEQSYFIGHFRPDGSSWQTVAPDYVQGECIAVDYRKAEDVVTAWFSVNKTRMNIMNPDYTQIGTSVYNINGTLFIAAEFGY